jgi:hypothetical protein
MLSLAFLCEIILFRDLVMRLFETSRWQRCCWCVPVFQWREWSWEDRECPDCPTSHLPGKCTVFVLKPHESVFHIFYYIMFTNIELSFPPWWSSLFNGQINTLIYLVLHISFVLPLQGVVYKQLLLCDPRQTIRTLREKILQVNPLVEAFGNTCTAINDNSSLSPVPGD